MYLNLSNNDDEELQQTRKIIRDYKSKRHITNLGRGHNDNKVGG